MTLVSSIQESCLKTRSVRSAHAGVVKGQTPVHEVENACRFQTLHVNTRSMGLADTWLVTAQLPLNGMRMRMHPFSKIKGEDQVCGCSRYLAGQRAAGAVLGDAWQPPWLLAPMGLAQLPTLHTRTKSAIATKSNPIRMKNMNNTLMVFLQEFLEKGKPMGLGRLPTLLRIKSSQKEGLIQGAFQERRRILVLKRGAKVVWACSPPCSPRHNPPS